MVLIDDVLYTGRTIRAALDALLDFGRPQSVKLCVLVNRRFNREFPIQPDFCGITVDSIMSQKVKVEPSSGEVFFIMKCLAPKTERPEVAQSIPSFTFHFSLLSLSFDF